MANTSARMLRLISLLQTHRSWAGGELATRLGISERTLRRDIDRLRELGYPVAAAPGVGGGYQLEAGATLPPLLLDDEEAIAIAVALRSAAGGGIDGIEETSVRALTKVVRTMPPRLRARVDTLQAMTATPSFDDGGPSVSAAAIAILAQACQDHERLRFEYTTRDRDRGSATRLVEPDRMVTLGRRWYLIAWDIDRADWRTFRVDRLRDPRSTRYRFEPRDLPGGDPIAFVRAQIGSIPARYQVAIRIDAPAATLERSFGRWVDIEGDGPDRSILRVKVDTLEWPVMIVAGLATTFEILEPSELVALVHATGERLAAATATATS